MRSRTPGTRQRTGVTAGRVTSGRVPALPRKIASSVAVVAAAAGVMGFAHFGGFADAHDPFPHSVLAPR